MTSLAERVRAVDSALIGRALAVNDDPVVHLGLTLGGRVGLRPGEATGLTVADYDPLTRKLRVAGGRSPDRTIRIADVAADEVEASLAGRVVEPNEPLLAGLSRRGISRALRHSGELVLRDLRLAAVRAAIDAKLPERFILAYFGFSLSMTPKTLIALPEDYDVKVADALNRAAFV